MLAGLRSDKRGFQPAAAIYARHWGTKQGEGWGLPPPEAESFSVYISVLCPSDWQSLSHHTDVPTPTIGDASSRLPESPPIVLTHTNPSVQYVV